MGTQETKWTPGPYEVAKRGTYPDDEGYKVLGPEQKNSKGHPVRYYMAQFVKSEAEANLFAAAPELYDAIINLLGAIDTPIARRKLGDDFTKEAVESSRAALAKARGEAQS